jgi:hypothetical protein
VGFARLEFRDGAGAVPADRVPPAVFSEVMRDLDLAAAQGRRGAGEYAEGRARARGELLTAVLGADGTDRITRHGDTVVITGSRAVYRAHLGTEAITVGDDRWPIDLPHTLDATRHPALFATVPGADYASARVLSRILLLAEDEKITDEWTLRKMGLSQATPTVCGTCGQVHP